MRPRTPPSLATLIVLTAGSVLAINMFVPSLPAMATEFDVDYGRMSLVIGAFLLTTAGVQLICGPLSDVYGRRPVILGGMAVFALASVLCAVTSDLTVFWIGRLLQASSAVGIALSRAVLRDQYEPREIAHKMATVSMVMGLGPLLGPALGGLIDEVFGWRGNFAAYALLAAGMVALAFIDLGETNRTRGGGMGAQFRAWPELLRSPRFWGYALCWSFSIATFHIFVTTAPLALTTRFGLSTGQVGLFMGMMSLGFITGSWVAGQMARRVDWPLTRLIIIGRVLACLALSLALLAEVSGGLTLGLLFAAVVANGVSNGLTSPNAASGVMAVRPHLAGAASGLSSAMVQLAGAIGTFGVGLVLTADAAVPVMLGGLLAASAIGLAAGLWLTWTERRRGIIRSDVPSAGSGME